MTTPTLKIGPIPDRTPIKLPVAVEPDLHADLTDYARVHSRAYGKDVSVSDLVPSMLRALMDGDAGFKRARKQLDQT